MKKMNYTRLAMIVVIVLGLVSVNTSLFAQGSNSQITPADNRQRDNNENRLDVNNVDAPFKPQGGAWFFDQTADYYVPKGSGKTPYFCYSFWLGARDEEGSLHLFAERYNQVGNDTWPGPLSTVDASIDESTKVQWDRTFKITRQEVLDFMANYQNPNYTIPQHILDWPAHGDTTKGQAWLLAPFIDNRNDGIYNPADGDYPDFPGDMAVFLIFNDSYAEHTESQGSPIGAEVHVMAYAYDAPEDSIMNNTIFLKYKIFNRSSTNYENAYIGLWSDWDVGYSNDDYVGCDVMRNTAYCYNGTLCDGSGQAWSYGEDWPVQTLTLLSGPLMPADSLDNPAYTEGDDCLQFINNGLNKYAINGTGFGDGIVDNERYGITGFIYHNNDNSVIGDPTVAYEYYNYMQGIWRDNSRIRYGGNGHYSYGASGPFCSYMFPGLSDPCNFGTDGIDPNPAQYGLGGWTEFNVGNNPYDRRGLASVGPFSLEAGGMQEMLLCLVTIPHSYAVNWDGEHLDIILDSLSHVNSHYHSYVGVEEHALSHSLKIYPNPTTDYVFVEMDEEWMSRHQEAVMVYDIHGKLLQSHSVTDKRMQLDMRGYPSGLYLIKVGSSFGKVIKK